MELTRRQFDIMNVLASSKRPLTQRDIEKMTGHSLGAINRCVRELNELGFVQNGAITENGLIALEPYRVKRAIFLAAGSDRRLSGSGNQRNLYHPRLSGRAV